MKNLLIYLLVFIGAISTPFSAKAAEPAVKPLIIGTSSGYAPFVSLDDKGQYEGFDVDLANLLSEKMKRPIVIKDLGSMPSLMMALKQKKIDMIMWGISITRARREKMEMIYYQGSKVVELPILFWREVPKAIQALSDFGKDSKRIVSVEAASTQEEVLKTVSNINLKYTDKIIDVIMDLSHGKCLAVSIDPALIPRVMQQYPEVKLARYPIPEELQVLGNGICIEKSNKALANEVTLKIDELIKEGKIAELEKKWNMVEIL